MTRPTFLILLFTFIISKSASAQFFAGISSGINFANVSYSNPELPETKTSSFVFGGLHTGYSFNDKWAVTNDLHFSQKGYWILYEPLLGPNAYSRYSYLDLVPQVEYAIQKNLAIGAGVYVSYLLQDAYGDSSNEWISPQIGPYVSRMDAGAVASLKLKIQNFFVFTRYQHGLVDIQKLEYTDINGNAIDARQKNFVIQLGAGYVFFRAKQAS